MYAYIIDVNVNFSPFDQIEMYRVLISKIGKEKIPIIPVENFVTALRCAGVRKNRYIFELLCLWVTITHSAGRC